MLFLVLPPHYKSLKKSFHLLFLDARRCKWMQITCCILVANGCWNVMMSNELYVVFAICTGTVFLILRRKFV